MLSDTRTNAGLDNISTYRKMYSWEVAGDTVITVERVTPPKLADRLPALVTATGTEVMAKLASSSPAGTVTLAGTLKAGLALARDTVAPPLPALAQGLHPIPDDHAGPCLRQASAGDQAAGPAPPCVSA